MQDNDTELTTYSANWLVVQTDKPIAPQKVSAQLLVLQTAFPAVVRNFDKFEFQALQSLWYDVFKNVPEEVMREAIRRFIINDRKGFFPSPGQIVKYVEQIAAEEKMRRDEEEFKKEMERYAAIRAEEQRLIEAGEICGNCKYCRRETPPPMRWYADWGGLVEEKIFPEQLYCVNPDSRKYAGSDTNHRRTLSSEKERCRCFARENDVAILKEVQN